MRGHHEIARMFPNHHPFSAPHTQLNNFDSSISHSLHRVCNLSTPVAFAESTVPLTTDPNFRVAVAAAAAQHAAAIATAARVRFDRRAAVESGIWLAVHWSIDDTYGSK